MTVILMSVMRGRLGAGSSGVTGHQVFDDDDYEFPERETLVWKLRSNRIPGTG